MPSKARGTGFYRRKGGAWKKGSGHGYKHVGTGKGTHSKRDPEKDHKRKARKGDTKNYSQQFD